MRAFSACWFAALTANRLQISNLQQIARTVAFIREQVLPRKERFSTKNHADGIFRMENPGIRAWRSSERNMQRRFRVNRFCLVVAKTPRDPMRTGDSRGGELTVYDCTAGSLPIIMGILADMLQSVCP